MATIAVLIFIDGCLGGGFDGCHDGGYMSSWMLSWYLVTVDVVAFESRFRMWL